MLVLHISLAIRLGEWIEDIRAKNKRGLLTEEQQIAVEELGLDLSQSNNQSLDIALKKRKEISNNSDDEYKPLVFYVDKFLDLISEVLQERSWYSAKEISKIRWYLILFMH